MIKQKTSSPSAHCFLFLSATLFLFVGCMSIPDQSKIQKFEDQKQKHQQLVSKLDNKDQDKQVKKPEKKKSQITMEVGEEEPVWANELPPECGETHYCGLAFKGSEESDDCLEKDVCRDSNETFSRNHLRKNIETKIRAQLTLYQYSQKDNEGESNYKQFEQEIRERGAAISLKNVLFRHFYVTPNKKLITLAMMEMPEEKKPEETPKKETTIDLPSLILVMAVDQDSEELNGEDLLEIVQLRLPELLSKDSFEMADNESIKLFGKAKISDLLSSFEELLKKKPDSVVFVASLKGDISANPGRLYPGITRMFLSFSAYKGKGKVIWKKTYVAKRLIVKKPEALSPSDRALNFRKTLGKGFNEIEKKGILKKFKLIF